MWSAHGDRKIMVEKIPTITFSRDFARKMKHLVMSTPTEISWVGEVEGDPRAALKVTNLHIMRQKVSCATFEEEDNAFVDLKSRIGEAVYKIRAHGHSHVNMGVTPSGTDQKDTVDNWKALEVPFLIRMIANKQGALRVDFFDFERGISVECIDFKVEDEPLSFPELDAEVKELVAPLPVPVWHTPHGHLIGGGKGEKPSEKNSEPNKNIYDDFWLYREDFVDDWVDYFDPKEEAHNKAKEESLDLGKFWKIWRGV